MGSRILSRSFHVEPWKGEDEPEMPQVRENPDPDVSMESCHSISVEQSHEGSHEQPTQAGSSHFEDGEDSDIDSEDGENVEGVAMVPMADMLNARYGGENVTFSPFQLSKYIANYSH